MYRVPALLRGGRSSKLAASRRGNHYKKMKSLRLFLVFAVLCLSFAVQGHAQAALIVQQKVSISQALVGHVNVGMAQVPAQGVTIEVNTGTQYLLPVISSEAWPVSLVSAYCPLCRLWLTSS